MSYIITEGELAQTFHWSVIHGSEPSELTTLCNKAFMVRYCSGRNGTNAAQ